MFGNGRQCCNCILQSDGKPQANETVLASFFNSLLSNKKQGGGRGGGRTSQNRVDVEAEIGKMQNKKS